MIRRVSAALLLVIIFCTCSCASTWQENAGKWASGAWEATKDFFSDDVPSYFTKGVEKVKAWWNDSDSNKIEKLRKEVAELNAKLDSFMKSFSFGAVNSSGLAENSHNNDTSSREAELNDREQAITERETQTKLRNEELISYESALKASADKLHDEAKKIDDFNRRQSEAGEKASAILAKLRENNYLGKFIDAGMLDKIDTEKFMLSDKNYGAMDIHYTPYGTLNANFDTSKYGFIDSGALKKTLKSSFRNDTFSLHGDSEVILVRSDDKSGWNNQIETISNNAFFTLEGLVSELEKNIPLADRAALEIESFLRINEQNGKLRLFFRTEHKGLYVIAVMESEKTSPVIYLAADASQKLIIRRDLPRELRSRIKLMNSAREAVLDFSSSDSKIDVYLDMFIKGLVENIPDYKDSF